MVALVKLKPGSSINKSLQTESVIMPLNLIPQICLLQGSRFVVNCNNGR